MNDHPLAWTAPQPFWSNARSKTAAYAGAVAAADPALRQRRVHE